MPTTPVEAWRAEWREQWGKVDDLLTRIVDALTGGALVTALDDLKVAVADNTEVSNRVADLVNTLQDQVSALQTSLDEMQAQTDADLTPLIDQVKAMTAELTAAEEPNTPAEPPVEEVPAEG